MGLLGSPKKGGAKALPLDLFGMTFFNGFLRLSGPVCFFIPGTYFLSLSLQEGGGAQDLVVGGLGGFPHQGPPPPIPGTPSHRRVGGKSRKAF